MKLDPQLYREIIESINVISRDEPQVADRRSPRVRLSSQLWVAMWSDPMAPLSMRVRDLSDGGIGIYHHQRIGLDEQLLIRFPRNNDQSVLVLGTVIYWEPLSEGLYGIGVQFDRVVTDLEITRRSDETVRDHSHQIGVMARITQAFARTWRVAS